MRLLSARIRMFRNILDSGEIAIEPDVTCLVGKNESGKTTVLQALHRQNPAPSPSNFDEFEDYPRWRYVEDRRDKAISQTQPIQCVFELEDDDIALVVAELGHGVLRSHTLRRSVAYSGKTFIGFDVDEATALRNYFDRAKVSDDLRKMIKPGAGPEDVKDGTAFVEGLSEEQLAEAKALANQVALRFGCGSAWTIAKDILKKRIPQFFYFSHYETLPGRIDLGELTGHEAPGQSGVQTARALLRLAGAEQEVLSAEAFDGRKAELEAVSARLSKEVARYWSQNDNLLVEIDADNAAADEPGRNGNGMVRYLDIRVRDTRHGYTGNFSQRSSGFQWFFSFLAAFSEFEDRGHGVIVLLDEPGLNLHGQAQADFLRFINERLGAKSQVIYATHSPFMVEPSRLDRVRVLEDRGIEEGCVVTDDVSAVGADSQLPLFAALGHDIAQNVHLTANNQLVGGTSRFVDLQGIREYLKAPPPPPPPPRPPKPKSFMQRMSGWRLHRAKERVQQ